MVYQSVQSRVSHDWIWEQGDPILGWSIAGNNDGELQMTLSYDLIEIFCLNGCKRRKAKVINNQQIGTHISFHPFVPGVISPPSQKITEEFDRLGEEDLISQTASLMAQSLGDVTFSYSCGAIKEDMLFLFDEATVAEISDEFGIELRVEGKVKPLQGLFFFERGPGEAEVEFFGFSSFDLILDQKLEEFDVPQRGALDLLETKL